MSIPLPLFGGPLPTASIASRPTQPTLGHICACCLDTGWVNRGTKKHPLMTYCVCAAGTRAFEAKLEKECPAS